nr:DUF2293 domain-containing protein [uncultured Desulfobulbus sp.]
MAGEERCLRLGRDGKPVDAEGNAVAIPQGWTFLAAGDAALTRKVTARTRFWRLQAQMGRRVISKGIWADTQVIEEALVEVEQQRKDPGYQRRLAADRKRRAVQQQVYEEEFCAAVAAFLDFPPCYRELQQAMAGAITRHAVPVGSGTVARTTRIPLQERASRAVIAWMRHQTTAYDSMSIARIKGERRRVRRLLAQRSVELLAGYRQGRAIDPDCPLLMALEKLVPAKEGNQAGTDACHSRHNLRE